MELNPAFALKKLQPIVTILCQREQTLATKNNLNNKANI